MSPINSSKKPQKPKRRRGVVLSFQGQQKLSSARRQAEIQDNYGDRYTLEELSDRTRLSLSTVTKVLDAQIGVDKQTLDAFFAAFGLQLERGDYTQPGTQAEEQNTPDSDNTSAVILKPEKVQKIQNQTDWGEAIDVSIFYGRTEELNTLKQWICQENSRLVAIVGIAGIGKTALTVKLVQQIYTHFEYIIWQSLHHPALIEKLIKTTQALSNYREIQLPISPQEQITHFINYLQHHRCLIILDNFDSLFQSGYTTGTYFQEYLDYRELLQKIAETNHQSCLILTSREAPSEVSGRV